MGKVKGFTLIEMLIATTLLMVLLATANFVYFQLVSRWDKELGNFMDAAKFSKVSMQLESVLSGIQPYIVRSKVGAPVMFFEGGEHALLATSTNGIVYDQEPVIFRLSLQNQDGKSQLLYQSLPLSSLILQTTEQEIVFTHSLVLLDDMQKVQFRYFGWDNLSKKSSRVGQEVWHKLYSGADSALIPSKIEFSFTADSLSNTLYSELTKEPNSWYRHYFDSGNI